MSGHDDRLVRRVAEAAAGRPAAEPCPDAEVLGLYAERMLDDAERLGVETHVVGCARCQAALAAFVRGAPEGEMVPGGEAEETAGGETGGDDPATPWWMGWKWLAPVMATAAVVAVAVWVTRPVPAELTMTGAEQPQAPPAAAAPAAAAPATPVVAAPRPAAAETPAATGRQGAALERPAAAPQPEAAALADRRKVLPEGTAVGSGQPAPVAEALSPPAPARQEVARERAAADTAAAQRRADSGLAAGARVGGVIAAAPAAALAATANKAQSAATLTGRVTYRTRQALPAGAVIEVRLLDVSRADAPAEVVGRVAIVTRGEQVPVPFAVPYDASGIEPRRRYTVQATITIGDRVAFRTTTAHVVLTSGAPAADVEVVVEPMR